jgi:hypothetical protein
MDELIPEAPLTFASGTIPNPDMPELSLVKSETIAVEPGHTLREYARNVVALGEAKRQAAELFEPKASFRL